MRPKTAANIAFGAIVIAYPIIIYFGLKFFEARLIAVALVVVAIARLILIRKRQGVDARLPHSNLVIAALLLVAMSALISNSSMLLQYYPVCMNIMMLVVFATTLIRPPSIIEQFARMKTPILPDAAIAYTRKVTIVWCGFFVVNGGMAAYTALATSMSFWALYNGLISYSLMGLLFAGEYLTRRYVQRNTSNNKGAKGWL